MTEALPFAHHSHGMSFLFVFSAKQIPVGKNIPIKNPTGKINITDKTIRNVRGKPIKKTFIKSSKNIL